MPPQPVRSSRWFIYTSTGLLVFLCLSVTLAGLLLLRKASQPLLAEIAGSSMEPTLAGPRIVIECPDCQFSNRWAIDSWNPRFEVRCMCCNRKLEPPDPPTIASGQRIAYRKLRWNHSPIQRFDTVVINTANDQPREVKRVVGLPNEDVAIRNGKLWVNDKPISPTPAQFLRQAVLMGHWSNVNQTTSLDQFLKSVHAPLQNNLRINAHDSHVYIAAQDYGVSFRLGAWGGKWKLRIRLIQSIDSVPENVPHNDKQYMSRIENPTSVDVGSEVRQHFCELDIGSGESTELWVNGNPVAPNPHHRSWGSPWITILSINGTLHVGDHYSLPWHSIGRILKPAEPESADGQPNVDLNSEGSTAPANVDLVFIETLHGDPAIDRCLVYRGIVYRGYRDSDTQRFLPDDGFVVLGDNVSISEDSRGAGDASTRIGAQKLRGVVISEPNDLDSLLRQSESLPSGTCEITD